MIAFGCSITEPEPYLQYSGPGIRRAAEPDSEIFAFAAVGTIGRSYNLLLEHAGGRDDLEALVLVHPYAEIDDRELCAKVRAALRDPRVGVVGAAGATSVASIAWWEGDIVSGSVRHRYQEYGGGEIPAFSWTQRKPPPAEVEVVDGWLMIFSPWVVRNVRFDEALGLGHGFDVDFCRQVRRAGRRVMVHDLGLIRNHDLEHVSDLALWVEAHIRMAEKWDAVMPARPAVEEVEWRQRARRAEAEREAARAIVNSRKYGYDARLRPLEDATERLTKSTSWRITEPLRRLSAWRRTRRLPASAG